MEKQTVFIKRYLSKGELPYRSHKYKRELFFTNKGYSLYEYETEDFNKEDVEWFYQPINLDEISYRAKEYFYNQTLDEHRLQDMQFASNFILNKLKVGINNENNR